MTLYRNATASDRDLVISTWSRSYKDAHAAGMIASEDWPTIMHAQIGKLLDRPTSRTIVAYEPPDFLYGFISGDLSGPLPMIWYVYVKGPYRSAWQTGTPSARSGPRHARGLFKALGVDPGATFLYACKTAIVPTLHRKIPNAKFAPAAARYTNYQQEIER